MSAIFLRRLGLVLALVLVMGLAVVPAGAQCTPGSGNNTDESFTCGPADAPDGLNVGSGSDTVTVTSSITIGNGTTPDGSIYSSGGTVWLVVNAGQTLNTGDHAVLMDGNGNILASGTIISQANGLYVQDGNGDITFGSGTTYDPTNYLYAYDVGMWVEGEGDITNSGEVDAGIAGLFVGDFDSLIDGGDLSSTEGVNELLDVSGITGGTITNYGDVDGGLFGMAMIGSGTIDNQGVVEGNIASVAAIGSDVVINNGSGVNTLATIEEGFIGTFGYGSGTMNNYGTVDADAVGMVFISQVQLGDGALEQIQNAGSEIEFYLSIADLVNSMEFEGEWTVNNNGVIDAPVGVLMLGNGTINNNGTIDSAYLGIGAYGNVDINNTGVINGSLVGAALIGQVGIDTEFLAQLLTPGAIDDSVTAFGPLSYLLYAAAALNAIEFEGGGTMTNSHYIGYNGTDYDTTDAVALGMIQLGNGSVVNTGDGYIYAEYLAMGLYGNGSVINDGNIYTGGVGMLFIGDISFDDELFFDIENVVPLLTEGDLFGPINLGSGTITNTGRIDASLAGIAAIGNVTVNNSGYVGGVGPDVPYVGIAAIGPNVTVNNESFVIGDLGIIAAGDNVEVNNSGAIVGEYVGLMVAGDSTVNNSGVIVGDTYGILAIGDAEINIDTSGYVYGDDAAIVGDSGDQIVNVDGYVESVNVIQATIELNGGQDRVNLRSNGHVDGDIEMGGGDDTVQIASGSQAHGLIDGGSEDNADVLIVGDENMCGEDENTAERMAGVRGLVESINLEDDTFNFDGEDYSVFDFEEGQSGVRSRRCYQFIEDGRINPYDMGAPVAGYCNVEEGLNVWAIDTDGNGQVDFSVSAEQMRTALEQAVNGGANVLIAQGARGSSLWALSTNQYQMMRMQPDGKTYAYIFEPGRCGPGGEIVVPS